MVKRALLTVVLAALSVSPVQAEQQSVPAGTTLHCRLSQTLTTALNFQGDPFTATVTEPLVIDGEHVIPVGSTIEGRIARMERPGRIRGVGQMRLSPERITFPDGRSYPMTAILLSVYGAEGAKVAGEEGRVKGPSSRFKDVQGVGAGMAVGGVVGTAFGGFHGTVVGATVGGVAGFFDRLRRRGKELTLPTGTQLSYQLTRSLAIYRENPRASRARRLPEFDD